MSTRAERTGGFTVLEAVVALAILGLAGVGALEAMGAELRAAHHARTATIEAALAQDRLAALALLPMADLQPLADSLARGTFPPPFADYHWNAAVRPVFGEADLYEITVDITGADARLLAVTRWYRPPPIGALP